MKSPTNWPHKTFQDRVEAAKRALSRLEQAEDADDRPAAQDLALMACSIAWHLADAVWHDGVQLGFAGFGDFKRDVPKARPSIATVRDVGEYAKHVIVDRPSAQDLGVETSVSAQITFSIALKDSQTAEVVREGGTVPPDRESVPKIRIEADAETATVRTAPHKPLRIKVVFPDGRRLSVADVVRDAIAEWEQIHAARTL